MQKGSVGDVFLDELGAFPVEEIVNVEEGGPSGRGHLGVFVGVKEAIEKVGEDCIHKGSRFGADAPRDDVLELSYERVFLGRIRIIEEVDGNRGGRTDVNAVVAAGFGNLIEEGMNQVSFRVNHTYPRAPFYVLRNERVEEGGLSMLGFACDIEMSAF